MNRSSITTLVIGIVWAVVGIAMFLFGNPPESVAQTLIRESASLPDLDVLGRFHFEYGTTQSWDAEYHESQLGAVIMVTVTQSITWTGNYGLRVNVTGLSGNWKAAAGVDYPVPGMSPTGTLTAHVYITPSSTISWAKLYILDPNWFWLESPVATPQPGNWITMTWTIPSTVTRPLNRFGVQFGGNSPGALDDALYIDAIDWSHPSYTQTIYTGAYLSSTGTINFPAELNWLDQTGGKHAGLINIFSRWPTDTFPTATVNTIVAHGSNPVITWEPWVSMTNITAGVYDNYIDGWAQAIKQTPCVIFLRWGPEMNGNWYTQWSGNPSAYIATWRHIHDRMTITDGVKNTIWVWSPNHESVPDGTWEYYNYYPGDGYVDWVGTSGYNAGTKASRDPKSSCASFDDLFSFILEDMTVRYPTKPQMIPEFGSACDNGCDKTLWISEAYQQALEQSHLQALVWFNVAKWEGNTPPLQWTDWRINCGGTCPTGAAAYARALANPRYSANAPCTIFKLCLPMITK